MFQKLDNNQHFLQSFAKKKLLIWCIPRLFKISVKGRKGKEIELCFQTGIIVFISDNEMSLFQIIQFQRFIFLLLFY